MKALIIVLLVLTVIALIPLGVDGGYNGVGPVLGIRVGFLNIKILPKKKKRFKLKKPQKAGEGKNPKEKKPFDKEQLSGLVKIALKALGRLHRKLRVDYLRIHYTFANGDPFETALGFGYSSAAVSAFLPLIDSAFNISERDIGTSFDFLSDRPSFDCWITATVMFWQIVYIAGAFGIDYLKLKHRQKREDRIRKE